MSLLFDTEPNFNAIPFSSTKGITPEALSRMLDNSKYDFHLSELNIYA